MDTVEKLAALGFPESCVAALERVVDKEKWIARFEQVFAAVDAGESPWRQLEHHLFELQAMCYLAQATDGTLAYEPAGNAGDKTCDVSLSSGGRRFLIELKAFHPEDKQREVKPERITPNNEVIMAPALFHEFVATRGSLIEATFGVESKLESYAEFDVSVIAVWLNYYLDLESYRDFVALYRGDPRVDDALAKMCLYYLGERKFKGTINQFWGLPFRQNSPLFTAGRLPLCVGAVATMDIGIADAIRA